MTRALKTASKCPKKLLACVRGLRKATRTLMILAYPLVIATFYLWRRPRAPFLMRSSTGVSGGSLTPRTSSSTIGNQSSLF